MPHTPALRKANWVNYKIYQNAAQLGSSAEETTLKEVYNLKEEAEYNWWSLKSISSKNNLWC